MSGISGNFQLCPHWQGFFLSGMAWNPGENMALKNKKTSARQKKNLVIIGAQWGDEGKAKMVDVLTEQVDIVARYQGGSNAGHTVVAEGRKIVFHQIPSGILHDGKTCLIGNGVVLDPVALLDEMDSLKKAGVELDGHLIISDRAQVLMPYHRLLDGASENRKGVGKIGTTNRGIGPAYMDKVARVGLRICDFFSATDFRKKLKEIVKEKNFWLKNYYGSALADADKIADEYLRTFPRIKPLVRDTSKFLADKLKAGKNFLAEGAQGTLLDVDFGTYPYVTSSSASVGGVCTGLGIGPQCLDEIFGVAKAYTTRVGEGPFPSEMEEAFGAKIRQMGGEFGATTGRPRRCGWMDLVALKYACRINGLTGLLITKLDVLSTVKSLKLCKGYKLGGRTVTEFPASLSELSKCEPVYAVMKGWDGDLSRVTRLADLPVEARRYLDVVEKFVEVPIRWISVGQDRSRIFKKN